jgi:predicted RNA binding protein YcfA (HicA-like mRNA interferase family)
VSQRGSHLKLRGGDGWTVIVKHPDRDVPPGTLKAILRQAGLTRPEFDDL